MCRALVTKLEDMEALYGELTMISDVLQPILELAYCTLTDPSLYSDYRPFALLRLLCC